MKKLLISIVAFLILLSIFASAIMVAKAETYTYVASISPTTTDVGLSGVTYTVKFNNTGTSGICDGTITIPSGYTSVSSVSITAPGHAWSVSTSASLIHLYANNVQNAVTPGQTITVTFSAKNPSSTGSYIWTTTANSGLSASGYPYTINGSQPTVTVNPALAAPTVSASKNPIDRGQTSSLSSTAVTTGTNPYTYQWLQKSPSSGSYSTISGATSPSYSFATTTSTATGNWNFELQVTDAASAVVTSNAVTVTVNSALVAPTVTANPATLVQGKASTLSSTSVTTGTSPYTYQWLQKPPGTTTYSNINGATSTTYTFTTTTSTTTGTWSFQLQVTDTATATATSNPLTVTVNAAPTVSISPSSWTMDVGQNKTFTATPTGGSGTYTSYQWYLGGVAQAGQTKSTFSFVPVSPGSYSITATVSDNSGVTSVQSSPATVTVNASPTVSITPVGPLTMNVEQTQVFTATRSGGSGVIHYQWYLDGSLVGNDGSTYSYIAAGTSHLITCKVTDSASFPVTSPTSNNVAVTVNPTLIAPIVTTTPDIIDQGQNVSLTSSTMSTGTSPYTYQWLQKPPGTTTYSNINGATSTTYTFTTTTSTTTGTWSFQLQVTDTATATATSNPLTVTVNAALVPSAASATPIVIDQGQISNLSSTDVTTGTSPYTYQWYSKAPGSSYVAVGSNSANYDFVTSSTTAAGSWSFILRVGDSTDVSVNSSAVSVLVNPIISASAGSGGSISPSGNVSIGYGSNQTFTITADSGYHINGVSVDGSSVSTVSSYAFTDVQASHTISATFALTPSPQVTAAPTYSPAPTRTPTSTPTTSPSPSPSPSSETTVKALSEDGATVYLVISGNITNSQISNITIATNQSEKSTSVCFMVTGESGTTGFGNVTIPKSAVSYGTAPTIYIDNQPAQDQGYAQDNANFYIWYTTHFSTRQVMIQFESSTAKATGVERPLTLIIVAIATILVSTIVIKRLRE